MAQQVEHILGKDEVVGSNPISSSRNGEFLLKFAVFSILKQRSFRYA